MSTDEGSGKEVSPGTLDVWQETTTGDGEVTRTIEQADAPQTLVVAAPTGAEVDSVTMTVVDGGWGTKALTTLVVGIVVLLLGLALLARSFGRLGGRRDRTARPTTEDARA